MAVEDQAHAIINRGNHLSRIEVNMPKDGNGDVAHDLLGSTHVFTSAIEEILEKGILKDIAGTQLTLSQFKLLYMVAMTEARTIGDVAVFLGVSNAAASKAVDKLVRRKLLRRAEGKPDRREICLSLTESGRRLIAAYEAKMDRKLAQIFRGFPEDEMIRAVQLLDRLSASLVGHHSDPDEVCLQCEIYFREKCVVSHLLGRRCFYKAVKSEPEPELTQLASGNEPGGNGAS